MRTRSPRGSGEQLRTEILDVTTELLIAAGAASAVSIRKVADTVGVTPPSIYLHFADKDQLVDSVVTRYFEQLDERLVASVEGLDHPADRLLAYGMTYVAFAMETPELYRLATMSIGECASDVDMVLTASAFRRFSDGVDDLVKVGYFQNVDDTTALVLRLWSAAHGIAALMIAKPYLPWADRMETVRTVLTAACMGEALMGSLGDVSAQESFDWAMRTTGRNPLT